MVWLKTIFSLKGFMDCMELSFCKKRHFYGLSACRSIVKLLLLEDIKPLCILGGGSLNSVVSVLLGFLKKEVLFLAVCELAGGVKGWAWGEKELENGFGGLLLLIGRQNVYNFWGLRPDGCMLHSISAFLNDSYVLVLLEPCVELKFWGPVNKDLGVLTIPDDF